jgi:hypothetical protein
MNAMMQPMFALLGLNDRLRALMDETAAGNRAALVELIREMR